MIYVFYLIVAIDVLLSLLVVQKWVNISQKVYAYSIEISADKAFDIGNKRFNPNKEMQFRKGQERFKNKVEDNLKSNPSEIHQNHLDEIKALKFQFKLFTLFVLLC